MKIALVAAALPPLRDGIGDYSARLAAGLVAAGADVTLITAERPALDAAALVPGVGGIAAVFDPARPRSVRNIAGAVARQRPDWVVLQYNPFSWGRRGFNPYLAPALRAAKRRSPGTRVAVMVHEPFTHVYSFPSALLSAWQRAQLFGLGRAADQVFFSIEPWARRFGGWFGRVPVGHLPVGSNIARVPAERDAERARLGIAPGALVLGMFGGVGGGRLLDTVRAAAAVAARTERRATRLLYVGPHGAALCAAIGDAVPVINAGALPAADVSRCFAAMDVYLAPFVDGVSTRRTSLMTALQHGVATVGTRGELTDALLGEQDEKAFLLADAGPGNAFSRQVARLAEDAGLRARLGCGAQRLYAAEFSWERITDRLQSSLREAAVTGPKAQTTS